MKFAFALLPEFHIHVCQRFIFLCAVCCAHTYCRPHLSHVINMARQRMPHVFDGHRGGDLASKFALPLLPQFQIVADATPCTLPRHSKSKQNG